MRIPLLIVTSLILCLPAAELAGINLGTHISGPKVSPTGLAGKVVVFEYWGIHCPPCLANIPHMAELGEVANSEVLAVIANQCQGPGSTLETWKSKGGNDKVTVIDSGDLAGAAVSGIPRIFVFDHTGKQVFDGYPGEVTKELITKLVDAAPGPLVKGGPYTACAAEAAALRNSNKSIAPVLKSLRTKAAGDSKAKEEATALLAGVDEYVTRQTKQLEADLVSDPGAGYAALNRLATLFKGDDLGKPFDEKLKTLKADKTFQNEIAAATALATLKDGIGKISSQAPEKQEGLKKAAASRLEALAKKFAGTKAAAEAEKMAGKL